MKIQQLMRLAIACIVLMTSACGVAPPIRDNVSKLDLSKNAVGLFTMEVENVYKPGHQPKLDFVFVQQKTNKSSKNHMIKIENPTVKKVKSKKKGDKSSTADAAPGKTKYLVSFELPPGNYKVQNVRGMVMGFLIIGNFMAPIYKDVTLEAGKVTYLGHVDAKVLERTSDDQLRAGSIFPLIDQAVVGASGGTFSINISDRFEQDMPALKERFKYLNELEIVNSTMSQWEQPAELLADNKSKSEKTKSSKKSKAEKSEVETAQTGADAEKAAE